MCIRDSVGPAPTSHTLTHVHQAASLPVEQVKAPTLRDAPVVTPWPPARSAGRYSRRSTEESHLSSRRSSLEPPVHRAQLGQLLAIVRHREKGIRREKPGIRTRIVIPRPGVPGWGHYRPRFPARLPTDWHHRLLMLLSNTSQTMWCCSDSPRPIFRSGSLGRLSSTACHTLARSSL